MADKPDYNWRTAPWRHYESFADFYQRECAPVWGGWSELQDTYQKLTRGEIDTVEAGSRISKSRERSKAAANQTRAEDKLVREVGLNQYTDPERYRQIADTTQKSRSEANGVSERTQRKLDHLAAHRPDLLAEVRAGEVSASRAYDTARGQVRTELDKLRAQWKRCSADERATFLSEVT